MQVSPLRYASVEMTDLWWVEGERFAPSREYPTHHDEAVMNGAPRSGGGPKVLWRGGGGSKSLWRGCGGTRRFSWEGYLAEDGWVCCSGGCGDVAGEFVPA